MLAGTRQTVADWTALAVFGRSAEDPTRVTNMTINGIRLSRRTVALMFASPSLLMALFSERERKSA
jgi:hypothetical protein